MRSTPLTGSTIALGFSLAVVLAIAAGGAFVTTGAAPEAERMPAAQTDAIRRVYADAHLGGDRAVLERGLSGTQTGAFAGIAPTGRHIAVPFEDFYELADGKIATLRIYGLADGRVHQRTAASAPKMESTRYRPGQPR